MIFSTILGYFQLFYIIPPSIIDSYSTLGYAQLLLKMYTIFKLQRWKFWNIDYSI
jgi:hypothetical protein